MAGDTCFIAVFSPEGILQPALHHCNMARLGRVSNGPWHQGRLREPVAGELRGLCNISCLVGLCCRHPGRGAQVEEPVFLGEAGSQEGPRHSCQTASVTTCS